MVIDKSLVSNMGALVLVALGTVLEGSVGAVILSTGLFALSGALTNWLAIHMLFERVPGLYGSGVIPLRFEEFKVGIREMIMEQFFDHLDVEAFLGGESGSESMGDRVAQELDGTVAAIDLDAAFEKLLDVILASSFGGMLGMLGGREALDGLREPFAKEMREYLASQFSQEKVRARVDALFNADKAGDSIRSRLEALIDKRLNEMTPEIVKGVVQKMIKAHLGWLVVWGAVFGGAIGFAVSALEILL